MTDPLGRLRRLLSELRRRNVYQVAVTYAVVAFVVWQAANLLFPALDFPGWTVDFVIVLTLLGFPLAVVLAWAFEMTPEGVRRTEKAEPGEEETGPEDGTRTGYKLLVGLGLVAAAVAGGWYLLGGGESRPEISDDTVAVMPFQVSGSGAETWRDGMVTLLTPGLDGAAGLRAISDRTVFAGWKRAGNADQGASTDQAIAVARQVGAEYAVVGSAVQLSGEIRLTAAVHETRSGERLGQVAVRGAPDSVPSLADMLARRTLEVLVGETEEELPSVDIGSITTRSLPALKSFLAGERHFRAGEYEAAIPDYEAAVKRDSTFALAYARLGRSHGWLNRYRTAQRYFERAYQFSDRLPAREQGVVRATYLRYEGRPLAAVDTLRRKTERYPDDPALWYALGEVLTHGYVPPGWPQAEEAFGRAIELNSEVSQYHTHFVDFGFALHRDSALAARRIAARPEGPMKGQQQLAWDLIFGSPERRQSAWAQIDTGSMPRPRHLAEWGFLHPGDAELSNRVLRRIRKRPDVEDDFLGWLLVFNAQRQGHLQEAAAWLDESAPSGLRNCHLAFWLGVGLPVPDSVGGSSQTRFEVDSLSGREIGRLYCTGLYLLERGKTAVVDTLLRQLQDATVRGEVPPELPDVVRRELNAYRAWKDGELRRVLDLWPSQLMLAGYAPLAIHRAIWRGDLNRDLGNLEKAEDWYLAAWRHPVAHERLGHIYEEMGQSEKAAAAYRRFIAAWKDADPRLQDRVEAARKRLRELTATESTASE